ncbi:MAG TPA: hypothetical protein VF808_12685 [Ktedonobacterales bacterium]
MTIGPDDGDDLELSDLLRTGRRRPGGGARSAWGVFRRRGWRWAPLAVSLALLAALAFSALPQSGALFREVETLGRTGTPTVEAEAQVSFGSASTPVSTSVLRVLPAPELGAAPTVCGAGAPPVTQVGPPQFGTAVGQAPVWLAGLSGAYPTFRLGLLANASAYGWNAPYTQFGWPAPMGLVLATDFNAPVLINGWGYSWG